MRWVEGSGKCRARGGRGVWRVARASQGEGGKERARAYSAVQSAGPRTLLGAAPGLSSIVKAGPSRSAPATGPQVPTLLPSAPSISNHSTSSPQLSQQPPSSWLLSPHHDNEDDEQPRACCAGDYHHLRGGRPRGAALDSASTPTQPTDQLAASAGGDRIRCDAAAFSRVRRG